MVGCVEDEVGFDCDGVDVGEFVWECVDWCLVYDDVVDVVVFVEDDVGEFCYVLYFCVGVVGGFDECGIGVWVVGDV